MRTSHIDEYDIYFNFKLDRYISENDWAIMNFVRNNFVFKIYIFKYNKLFNCKYIKRTFLHSKTIFLLNNLFEHTFSNS